MIELSQIVPSNPGWKVCSAISGDRGHIVDLLEMDVVAWVIHYRSDADIGYVGTEDREAIPICPEDNVQSDVIMRKPSGEYTTECDTFGMSKKEAIEHLEYIRSLEARLNRQ